LTEEHANKNNSTLYIAVIALVIALAAVGYAATQGDAFNKRITLLEQTQTASNAKLDSSLAKMNSTLDSFNTFINSRLSSVEAAMTLYYDSDCTTCQNEVLMKVLEGMAPDLKQKGITFNEVDVRGEEFENIVASGINRVPAIYASSEDLNKAPAGTALKNLIDAWSDPSYGFDYYYVQGGIALTPKSPSEMLTDPCLGNATSLQYFYSETCKYCKRVKAANGTLMNPDTDAAYKTVIGESLEQVKTAFGETLNATQHCLGVHTVFDNYETLGVNKSDEQICVETQGEPKTIADNALAARYRFSQPPSVPVFVVNCKYLFKVNATTADAIKQPLCAIKPSLPACKT
jgi:hypothetical protein